MNYNFDNPPSRKNSASLKWDHYGDQDILPMWIADMDFKTAPEIINELKTQIEFGIYGYTHAPKELIAQTIQRLQDRYQWKIEADWLVWLPGLVPALNMACRSIGKDGDKILTLAPIYPPFLKAPHLARRQKVTLDLVLNNDCWEIDFKQLEEKIISENIKVLLLCNPHNPVGKIFSREELTSIAEICVRHQVLICSDEIHNDLILHPNKKHICIASLTPEISNLSITLMSPSKTFNLPGLCCSFAIIPNQEIRNEFVKSGEGFVPHPGIIGYAGCYAAFAHGNNWHKDLITYLQGNLEYLKERIADIPKIKMNPPEATYLAWIDVRDLHLINPGKYFESKGLGLSDGRIFKGDGFVRLNFGTSKSILKEGLDRLENGVLSAIG
jgi:cystathionine beta-lyase